MCTVCAGTAEEEVVEEVAEEEVAEDPVIDLETELPTVPIIPEEMTGGELVF